MVGGLILAPLYTPTLRDLADAWWTHPYAGHGPWVPAFSAFFLWTNRARIRAAVSPGHAIGLAVILLALGLLFAGRSIESLLLQGVSVVMCLAGMVLWIFGPRTLQAAAFPVAFLLLMLPLPNPVVSAVTQDLQLFAARTAGAALDLLDVPFFLDGVLIQLPGITLTVATVCNGLRFLSGLLVLTIAFAQVSQRSLPRKLILVASAIPIAILANAVRVATIALAVYYIGPSAAQGFIHNSIAKSVWALTLVPLVTLALLLRRGGESPRIEASQSVAIGGN
jgi:exosortase